MESPTQKKRRGRPRKVCDAASSRERRRAQVREATKALRLRKEAAVSSLEQRNVLLEDVIERMRAHFLEFSDAMLRSPTVRADLALARQLRSIMQIFVSLNHSVTAEPEAGTEKSDRGSQRSTGSAHRTIGIQAQGGPISSKIRANSDPTFSTYGQAGSPEQLCPSEQSESSTVQQDSVKQFGDIIIFDPLIQALSCVIGSRSGYPFATYLDPTADLQLNGPSFGQRLFNVTLRVGLGALRNEPGYSSQLAQTIFRHSFLIKSRYELATGIRLTLESGISQYCDEEPSQPLDSALKPHDRTNPRRLHAKLATPDSEFARAVSAIMIGAGGADLEYLDAWHVEDYLKGKGIFSLDANTVQILRAVPEPSIVPNGQVTWSMDSSTSSSGRPQMNQCLPDTQRRHVQTPSWNIEPSFPGGAAVTDICLSDFLTPGTGNGLFGLSPEVTDIQEGETSGYQAPSPWLAQNEQRPKLMLVTLSMQALLQNLAELALCTGHGPGYLPKDIDAAINASRISVDAY